MWLLSVLLFTILTTKFCFEIHKLRQCDEIGRDIKLKGRFQLNVLRFWMGFKAKSGTTMTIAWISEGKVVEITDK